MFTSLSLSSFAQYLNPASLHDPSLQDAEGYRVLEQSMDKIGLSASEKADLFRVVAAVLHLGNITFEENLNDKKGIRNFLVLYSGNLWLVLLGI